MYHQRKEKKEMTVVSMGDSLVLTSASKSLYESFMGSENFVLILVLSLLPPSSICSVTYITN